MNKMVLSVGKTKAYYTARYFDGHTTYGHLVDRLSTDYDTAVEKIKRLALNYKAEVVLCGQQELRKITRSPNTKKDECFGMSFGKHKGKDVREMTDEKEVSYLHWLVNNFDLSKASTYNKHLITNIKEVQEKGFNELEIKKQAKEEAKQKRLDAYKEADAKLAESSNYQHEVGQKVIAKLTCVSSFECKKYNGPAIEDIRTQWEFDSYNEYFTITRYVDENNNVYVQYGNTPDVVIDGKIVNGKEYKNAYTFFTVKKHTEYNGIKQTSINRLSNVDLVDNNWKKYRINESEYPVCKKVYMKANVKADIIEE